MPYFDLFDDVHIRGRWHLGNITLSNGAWTHLLSAAPAAGVLHTSITHGRLALDFCLTSFAVPVARAGLAVAMHGLAGTDFQRIPLVIRGRRRGHEVINVLRVVDCIDEARSSTARWEPDDAGGEKLGRYRSVDTLTVDPRRVPPDAHIFRTAGWPVGLIVSQAMMSVMKSAGARGATFTPVST